MQVCCYHDAGLFHVMWGLQDREPLDRWVLIDIIEHQCPDTRFFMLATLPESTPLYIEDQSYLPVLWLNAKNDTARLKGYSKHGQCCCRQKTSDIRISCERYPWQIWPDRLYYSSVLVSLLCRWDALSLQLWWCKYKIYMIFVSYTTSAHTGHLVLVISQIWCLKLPWSVATVVLPFSLTTQLRTF